jgi:pimeloyl-ACP methyl ester carboxylesterase
MRAGIRNSTLQIVAKAGHYAAFERPAEVGIVLKQILDPTAR